MALSHKMASNNQIKTCLYALVIYKRKSCNKEICRNANCLHWHCCNSLIVGALCCTPFKNRTIFQYIFFPLVQLCFSAALLFTEVQSSKTFPPTHTSVWKGSSGSFAMQTETTLALTGNLADNCSFKIFISGNPAFACRACPRHQGRTRWRQRPLLSCSHCWTSGLTFWGGHI